ncbi:MAG: CRISPR-associated helicase Cas3' [Chloroflexi bacterium]|nr:CRISPR-associated helicase Cas3' [Chloroflexota bacterium]
MGLLTLWAKKSPTQPAVHHPLLFHMLDVALVAQVLWDRAIGRDFARQFQSQLGLESEEALPLLSFWAGLHDIGKASPAFQGKSEVAKISLEAEGYAFPILVENHPHGPISNAVLRRLLSHDPISALTPELSNAIALTLGGHHGSFPIPTNRPGPRSIGSSDEWTQARLDLYSGLSDLISLSPRAVPTRMPDTSFFLALAGYVCISDWIGSNEAHFVYESGIDDPREYLPIAKARAVAAVDDLGWHFRDLHGQPTSFSNLFPGFQAIRPLQSLAESVVEEMGGAPGIVIIEAPMGEGKTEAAMLLAEHWNRSLGQQGTYFALPTQATSNQMYQRITSFLRGYFEDPAIAVNLVHGNSLLSTDLTSLSVVSDDETHQETTIGTSGLEWFYPKKRALLSQFGVGTIDQSLLAVMQTKHFFVRLFGLANKTVVIDEVHAYDTYMSTLLERLINWLGQMGSSVILLSATLPKSKRTALLNAFKPSNTPSPSYPRLTWASGGLSGAFGFEASRKYEVNVKHVPKDNQSLIKLLRATIKDGGCVCVVRNTVRDAQETYRALKASKVVEPGDLFLLHARFPYEIRQSRELAISRMFGPGGNRPAKAIVVATQVLEQSLDLDFDLMVTDLAPADLVLQRSGRMHRHFGTLRPVSMRSPELWIMMPEIADNGVPDFGTSRYVYDPYILLRSFIALRNLASFRVPGDIESIVDDVYEGEITDVVSDGLKFAIHEAELKFNETKLRETFQAEQVLIQPPEQASSATEFLRQTNRDLDEDNPELHTALRALTRLSGPSVSVICLEEVDGQVHIPSVGPWIEGQIPNLATTRQLLMRSMSITDFRLVFALIRQPVPSSWRRRPALRYHRVLVFKDHMADVNGHWVRLDDELGLEVDRKLEFNEED